jgi:hypothetical protein
MTASYDGAAIVERSTPDELVLAFPSGAPSAGDGGADAPPAHLTIRQTPPLSLLPRGARVWLSKSPKGNQQRDVLFYGQDPSAFSVRNGQAGKLILGSAYNSLGPPASPAAVGVPRPTCTTANSDFCAPGTTITYSAVEVKGDVPVSIADGETRVVTMGGLTYDARVTARQISYHVQPTCADYHPRHGVTLDIVARDWNLATEGLELGVLPACVEGNDGFGIVHLSAVNRPTYEGPVFFLQRSPYGVLEFSLFAPGTPGDATVGFALSRSGDVPLPSPVVGQEYWMSVQSRMSAMRDRQGGRLIVGTYSAPVPLPDGDRAQVEQLLGISVTTEQRCQYAVDQFGAAVYLHDVVIGSTPAVRIISGSVGKVPIAGTDHNVMVRALGKNLNLTVYGGT